MRDDERKDIIAGINRIIDEKKELKRKYQELKKLIKDPTVKQYLELIDDINNSEKKLERFDSIEKIIDWEFSAVLHRWRKDVRLTPCNHALLFYEGSYYLYEDFLSEHDHIIHRYSENAIFEHGDYPFLHNKYVCLECGKKFEIKDWKKFENSHFILKDQNEETNLGAEHYIQKYYQLLYKNSVKKSQETIIKEFEKQKQMILKK